jgi:hypothetical protein
MRLPKSWKCGTARLQEKVDFDSLALVKIPAYCLSAPEFSPALRTRCCLRRQSYLWKIIGSITYEMVLGLFKIHASKETAMREICETRNKV